MAQRLTQLEVRLATSEQDALKLRAHNADLERDLVGLIELKLALAEARNELAEARGAVQ